MGHEAGESCGFDHSGSFLKERTWRRGADGANDVWARFLRPVMPHLWSRHRSCRLWKRGINSHFWFPGDGEMRQERRCASASERWDEISAEYESDLLCSRKAFSPPFISLFWAVRASSDQPLLMLFCCHGHHVLLYAPRYRLHGKKKIISSLEASSQIINSSNFIRNNSLIHICTFSQKGFVFS